MANLNSSRLGYIDWMRGVACVLMFQTHCYDAWLSPLAKKSPFFIRSQLLGTLPAPSFLFLAGISFAFASDRSEKSGRAAKEITLSAIRRGSEILALGFLFRVQEYLISFPWAPWTDLFRVDILNTIGVAMMMMAGVCWPCRMFLGRAAPGAAPSLWLRAGAALGVALLISLLTPLVWTVWRPTWLPWPIESYVDGVHNLGKPQGWLFPIFPWTGFAFIGLALGFLLLWARVRRIEALTLRLAGGMGILLITAGRWLDKGPQVYPLSDFWHTSPNFFLIRVGILLLVLSTSYLWCRWGAGGRGFSPLIQLGQTSLLVYWVHIELVYGRFSILRKQAMGIGGASLGLLTIFLAMLLLSLARTRLRGRAVKVRSWAHMSPGGIRIERAGQ